MDISFIILTWNSEKHIFKCLKALFIEAEQSELDYEIYIIDNGSKDNSVSIINSFKTNFPQKIIPIFLNKNMGTTYPRNIALKKATGDFICILDSDVELSSGVILNLIRTIKKQPAAGMIVPKLVYPDGSLQKSIDKFPTVFSKLKRYFFLKQIENKEQTAKSPTGVFPVEYAISAMWVITRKAFDHVGLLDEKIFYAPEDVDYCYRMWKSGYKILYHSDVMSVHHAQEISRGFKINIATISHLKGLIYYFIKHKYFFKKRDIKIPENSGGFLD